MLRSVKVSLSPSKSPSLDETEMLEGKNPKKIPPKSWSLIFPKSVGNSKAKKQQLRLRPDLRRQVVACRVLLTSWYFACLILSDYFCSDVLGLRDGLIWDLTVFQTVVRGRRGGQSGWHLVSGIGTTAPIANFLLRLFLLLLLLL